MMKRLTWSSYLMATQSNLTDNLLARVYTGIQTHHTELLALEPSLETRQIYDQLRLRLTNEILNQQSKLYFLSLDEQNKIQNILDTYFLAAYHQERDIITPWIGQPQAEEIKITLRITNYALCCDAINDAMFNWMLLSLAISHSGGMPGHIDGQAAANIIMIALAISALIALCYIVHVLCEVVEQLWHSEGGLKPALAITSLIGGGAAGAVGGVFLGIALAGLVANPIGLIIGAAICTSLIAAALTVGFVRWVQPDDQDALDPKDAHRYTLTEAEERNLILKHIDPVKVKCAMVALRHQMNTEETPSFLYRHGFGRAEGRRIQDCLDEIRALRQGKHEDITVGSLVFDLRLEEPQDPFYGRDSEEDAPLLTYN